MIARRLLAFFFVSLAIAGGARIWFGRGTEETTKTPNLNRIRSEAQRHIEAGEWEAVVGVLNRVPDDSFAKPKALLEQGRAYWELSNGPALERTLRECIALEADPENPSDVTFGAWGTLGDHYYGQERFDEAREAIWQSFDAHARRGRADSFYLLLLLRMRFEITDPSVALQRLEAFLQTDPEDADAHRTTGIVLARTHRLEEAERHLLLALQSSPTEPRFHDAWLSYLFLTGDYDRIEAAMDALPEECDSIADFLVFRAKFAAHRQDWPTALRQIERALEIEPGRIDAAHLYSQALRRAGRSAEADVAAERAKRLLAAYTAAAEVFKDLDLRKGRSPEPSVCEKMIEVCDVLHWEREREAWKKVLESVRGIRSQTNR